MILKAIKKIIKNFYLSRGYKTDKKIIVIESDDWGSVRSNYKGLELIKKNFPKIELDNYQLYDTVETEDDIMGIINILDKYKLNNGSVPKFTANYIMFNPKFENFNNNKILMKSNTGEINRYKMIFDKYDIYFHPQLHGYEHFNYDKLIKEINTNTLVKEGFNNGIIGLSDGFTKGMDAFTNHNAEKINVATKEFNSCFGYYSKSFIFPCYIWSREEEKQLFSNGVEIIQSGLFQYVSNNGKYKIKMHYMGQKNKFGQIYLQRNCQFEPSKYLNCDKTIEECVNNCLNDIEMAFKRNKPAIICSHRVNYIGSINKKNQIFGLTALDMLLKRIIEKYKNVEFMTSDELGQLIKGKK